LVSESSPRGLSQGRSDHVKGGDGRDEGVIGKKSLKEGKERKKGRIDLYFPLGQGYYVSQQGKGVYWHMRRFV